MKVSVRKRYQEMTIWYVDLTNAMTYHLLYILMRMDAITVWIYGDVTRPSNLKGGFSNRGINPQMAVFMYIFWSLEVVACETLSLQFTQIMNSQVSAIVACWISLFFWTSFGCSSKEAEGSIWNICGSFWRSKVPIFELPSFHPFSTDFNEI